MGYRIAIVEDDKLILELVSGFLLNSESIDSVIPFFDGQTFLDTIDAIAQDLDALILDFRLGEYNAEMLLVEMQSRGIDIPTIILTSNYNQYLLGHMIRAGVAGYFPKNIKPDELLHVIHEVISKGHYISADQFPYLKIAFSDDPLSISKSKVDVSDRDIELIYLLATQLTAKEISDRLCVSPKTIEGYKNTLFVKTKTKNVVGLVVYAIQNGLISPDEIDLMNEN